MEQNCYKPYIFQSGKYIGRSVEEILFEDPIYIGVLFEYKKSNKAPNNALYQHLEVLMNYFPETLSKCPVCQKKNVRYFLYLNNETVSKNLICCDNPECQEKLKENHRNDYLLPMKFSSLMIFKQKTLRKKVITLLKNVTGLKGKPSADKIINIFSLPPVTSPPQLDINF